MESSGLIRWGAIGLMLGGVIWLILGVSVVFGYLQPILGREDVVLFIVALALTAAGLAGLQALAATMIHDEDERLSELCERLT